MQELVNIEVTAKTLISQADIARLELIMLLTQ
jgi:hypothetical protein